MTEEYRWKITRDRIDDGEAKGVEGPANLNPSVTDTPVHLPNAGCTYIKIDGEIL